MTRNTDTISEFDEKWHEIEKELCETYLDKFQFNSSYNEAENNEIKKNILNFFKKIFNYSLDVKLHFGNKDSYDSQIISHDTYKDPEKRAKYLNNLFLQFSKNVISDLSSLEKQVNLLDDKVGIILTALFSKIHEELAKKLQDKSPEQKKEFLEYRQLFIKGIIRKTSKDFQKIFNKSSENLQLYFFENINDPKIPKDQEWLSKCLDLLAKKLEEKLTEDQKTTYNSFIENLQDLFSTAISLKLQITEEQAKEDPTQLSIFQTTYDDEHERSEFIKKIFEHKAQTIIKDLSEFSKTQTIDHQTLTTLKEQYFEFFTKYFSDKLSALKEDKLSDFIKLREYFFKKLEEADTQKILFDDSNLAKETFEKLISNGQEIISRNSPNPQGSDANRDNRDDKADFLQKDISSNHENLQASNHENLQGSSARNGEEISSAEQTREMGKKTHELQIPRDINTEPDDQLDDQLKSLNKSSNDLESLLIQIKSKLTTTRQANLQELSNSSDKTLRTTEVAITLPSQQSKSSQTISNDFNSKNFQDQSTQTQDQDHIPTPAEINLKKEIDQKNKVIQDLESLNNLLSQRVQELESSNNLLSQRVQETIDNLLKITSDAEQILSYQQTQYQLLDNQKEELTKSLELAQDQIQNLSEQLQQKQELEKEKEKLKQTIQEQKDEITSLNLKLDNQKEELTKSLELAQDRIQNLSEQLQQKQELEKEKEKLNQIIQEQNDKLELLHREAQAKTNNANKFDTQKLQPSRYSPIYSGPYTKGSFDQSNPDHNQEAQGKQDNGDLVPPEDLNESDSDYQEMEDVSLAQRRFSLDDPSRNRLLPRVLNPILPSRLSDSDLTQVAISRSDNSPSQDPNGKTSDDADPLTPRTNRPSPDPATAQENFRPEISSSQPSQNFLPPSTNNSQTDPQIINSHKTLTEDQAPDTNNRPNTVTYHEPIEAPETLKTTSRDQSWGRFFYRTLLGDSPGTTPTRPPIGSPGGGRSIDERAKPLGWCGKKSLG